MRTTLDIDADLLAAAQEIARRERTSAGKVVSRLLRSALAGRPTPQTVAGNAPLATGGFRPFASRGQPVTNAGIDHLRDSEGV